MEQIMSTTRQNQEASTAEQDAKVSAAIQQQMNDAQLKKINKSGEKITAEEHADVMDALGMAPQPGSASPKKEKAAGKGSFWSRCLPKSEKNKNEDVSMSAGKKAGK
jgi:hypothetical protein